MKLINQKTEIKYLKTEVENVKTNHLTLEAKIALLQTQTSKPEIPLTSDISGISDVENTYDTIPTNYFQNHFSKLVFHSKLNCRRLLC